MRYVQNFGVFSSVLGNLITSVPHPASDLAFVTLITHLCGPTGSTSRGGDVAVCIFDLNHSSFPTPFYSVLVPVSVFMALSIVFHSINYPDNSPLSRSVLLVLFLPYWSFQLYISL